MKRLTKLLLSALLLLPVCMLAQRAATNAIPYSQAVKIASGLTVGMKQSEARKVLQRHGFGENPSGIIMHHMCFFQQDPLAESHALELEYEPTISRTNDFLLQLATSRLLSASIRSNGIHVISITLSNWP